MSAVVSPVTASPESVPTEEIDAFAPFGIRAFTTMRQAGSFGLAGEDPVRDVIGRWRALQRSIGAPRLVCSPQVHGSRVLVHRDGWEGWLRGPDADGHATASSRTALAIGVADCVPVLMAHPSGAIAAVHSGWRGTVAGIVEQGIFALSELGAPAAELRVVLGPAICGRCYEVGPDVYAALTGKRIERPQPIDLRGVIADRARAAGVRDIAVSGSCTRCDNDRFFSHRAGDAGRQIAVIFRAG